MAIGGTAQPKPPKGTAKFERQQRRKDLVSDLDKLKAECKALDHYKCRLPHCPFCAQVKGMQPQSAHVAQAMGIGGDPTLIRSQLDMLMTLDPLAHGAQERGELAIVPLTEKGTRGPCEFYLVHDVWDPETGRYSSARVLWAKEIALHVPEQPAGLCDVSLFRSLPRRQKVTD